MSVSTAGWDNPTPHILSSHLFPPFPTLYHHIVVLDSKKGKKSPLAVVPARKN